MSAKMQLSLFAFKNAPIIMVVMSVPVSQDMKVMAKAMEQAASPNTVPCLLKLR
jgi:hypothetical protein